MDVEGPESQDATQEALDLLNANSILPALSNPAFEVWILAHFEKTGAAFLTCDAVVTRLNKHWQQNFSADYDKADGRIYWRLAPLTDQAIGNAKWVREQHHTSDCIIHCNSATDVYRLVGLLRGRPV
jgi:hypothetical protein